MVIESITPLRRLTARELTGHVAQVISTAGFAIGIMVQKDLTQYAPAEDIVALQLTLSLAPMWLICAYLGHLPRRASEILPGLLWGCLTPGLVFLFASAGAALTDGVSIALIWGLAPLLVPFMGRLILGERFHWTLPIGAVMAFAGIIVLTLDRQGIGEGNLAGNLLVGGGMLSASFGQIVGRRLNTRGAPWFRIATLQVTGAACIASVAALFDGALVIPPLDNSVVLVQIVFLVLGMTMANFIGYNLALSRIPVAWISLYNSLNPVIGTVAAVLIVSALVRPFDIAGIAIVMSGIALPHLWRVARAGR